MVVQIDIVKTCIQYEFEGCNTLNKRLTCQIFLLTRFLN